MTKLWLVRHGQTDWNFTGRWQGQSPAAPGLNNLGRAQVLMMIRKQLKKLNLSAIYSSDLLRARQTAELIAESLEMTVTLEPRLREIDLGVWEGMLSKEIEARYSSELAERDRNPLNTRAPLGESLHDVRARVFAAVNDIADKHPNESILIVSHGIALAAIICRFEGFRMEDVYQHIPDNAQPYQVRWPARGL
jgi:broad specificity phosphatase PhoE